MMQPHIFRKHYKSNMVHGFDFFEGSGSLERDHFAIGVFFLIIYLRGSLLFSVCCIYCQKHDQFFTLFHRFHSSIFWPGGRGVRLTLISFAALFFLFSSPKYSFMFHYILQKMRNASDNRQHQYLKLNSPGQSSINLINQSIKPPIQTRQYITRISITVL